MLKRSMIVVLAVVALVSASSAKGDMQKMMYQSVPAEKAIILQEGKNRHYCPTCGMTLPMFYRTNHAATVDGKAKQYCSIHCAVEEKDLKSMDLKEIKAVDAKSLKFIDAVTAHYVIGSGKKGTMSMVSKYAFADKIDAKAFAKENGGTVAGFKEAWAAAKKDFSPAMIEKMKAKKALMAQKGAKAYKMKCKQTPLPTFHSIAEAKAYIVENNFCPEVKGKPLQAIGIYLLTK
ncbi:MAG: nitrous oxide reductase accessory protein NosL [Epsilonproteobacteria bacterium]|nr:nitrous oxide reductase accessory protein NosL [Campylobacterota bacterium]